MDKDARVIFWMERNWAGFACILRFDVPRFDILRFDILRFGILRFDILRFDV
jgi:hypothetical protein